MTNRFRPFLLVPLFLAAGLILGGCGVAQSSVPFASDGGHRLALRALNPAAKDGILEGADSTAWFSFRNEKSAPARAVEVAVRIEAGGPVTLSLAPVFKGDISSFGTLSGSPVPRDLSTVLNAAGVTVIRMTLSGAVPSSGTVGTGGDFAPNSTIAGFALRSAGTDASRVRILSAALAAPETGWQKTSSDSFWFGFGPAGGTIDAASPAARAAVPAGSLVTISFVASDGLPGTIEQQSRTVFSLDSRSAVFRHAPAPYTTSLPSLFFRTLPAELVLSRGGETLSGMRVSPDKSLPVADPADVRSPILADPHMVIEWPLEAWRAKDYEIFAWDRFPSILIFDTADYAVQDRFFKRLAFFTEKQGYKGKLWTDAELSALHAYNAHDYRAENLAAFFELARTEKFPLNAEETELREILLAEGILRKQGSSYEGGAGAVLSISRQSVSYLRYLFVAHEGYHGIYFIDPDFRAKVEAVYRSMDPKAVAFLETYFTVVDSLGYDTDDQYLMENEFMAYLMQQPLDKVAPYFTGTISERFLRYGGKKALADYISATDASEFTRAAAELNAYVFERWGISGGRTGLFFLSTRMVP